MSDQIWLTQINGVWRSEIVRDQNVIKGYVRQRNELDAEEVEEPENLVLTGDPEKDAIVKKKCVSYTDLRPSR